jgi:hypothetical protein
VSKGRTRRTKRGRTRRELNALLAWTDRARASLRKRLARFDDAALARLASLFDHLARVVAIEAPADDATIEAIARTHDLFFPIRPPPCATLGSNRGGARSDPNRLYGGSSRG